MNYKAMYEQVLIDRIMGDEELTEGGLYKPGIAQVKGNKGTVLSIGSLVPEKSLNVGDVVLFASAGADDVPEAGKNVIIIHYKQITALECA